jgi:5-methylcytosine-specific restriction endonuclease McrA
MKRANATSRTKTCAVDSCDRPLKARGMCPLHYKAWRRSEFGREATTPQEWTDARRDTYHRRRALKLATAVDGPVIRDEIAERDEYRCGLCGEPVDMDVAYPDTLSPSLDHILPLSRGGSHTPGNVQLAHLGCNVAKGARVAVAA